LRLVIVGAGYVGLPTAALFANAGFHVDALDIRPEVINALNNGQSFTNEPGLKELISINIKSGRLKGYLNYFDYSKADAILIAVQTPISEDKKPNLVPLMKVINDVGKNMKKGTIVVVNSTIPSGSTKKLIKPRLELLSGFKAEKDFYLVFVPERIAPGKAIEEFIKGTRLIGGVGKNSSKTAGKLFNTVCDRVLETDATVAEISKLAENTFRDINIAYANQLSLICAKLGADVIAVIKLANTHPRVNIHLPGPGVGGPCLSKDPYYLLDGLDPFPNNIVLTSRMINEQMPEHMVCLVSKALANIEKRMMNSRITILGVAYKNDVDDSRYSPSEPLIHSLTNLGCQIVVYDPYCKETFGAKQACSLFEAIRESDCLVIVTNHTEFLDLDLQKIKNLMNKNPVIVDGRRIVNPSIARKTGFIYYGIGISNIQSKRQIKKMIEPICLQ